MYQKAVWLFVGVLLSSLLFSVNLEVAGKLVGEEVIPPNPLGVDVDSLVSIYHQEFSVEGIEKGAYNSKDYFEITAYTNGYESTGKNSNHPAYGITASGTTTHPGVVAAPRSVLFGTLLWIPLYGYAIVEDRGGAITEGRLDVWIEDLSLARSWGRRTLEVKVLRWGRGGNDG